MPGIKYVFYDIFSICLFLFYLPKFFFLFHVFTISYFLTYYKPYPVIKIMAIAFIILQTSNPAIVVSRNATDVQRRLAVSFFMVSSVVERGKW